MSELFDPYHGDGWVEPLAAELASILIPYGGAMKGYKLIRGIPTKPQKVIKEKRTAPALFGSVQEQVLKPHRVGKGKGTWARRERFKRRGKGLVKEGLGIGAATTVIYSPEEDLLTDMIEQFPESLKVIEGLAINPNDSGLQKH